MGINVESLDKVQAGDIYLNLIIYSYKKYDYAVISWEKDRKKWWFLFAFTISDFQESEGLCNSSGRI